MPFVRVPIPGVSLKERDILGAIASPAKGGAWTLNYKKIDGKRSTIGATTLDGLRERAEELNIVRGVQQPIHHDQPHQHAESSQGQYSQGLSPTHIEFLEGLHNTGFNPKDSRDANALKKIIDEVKKETITKQSWW